MLVQAILLVQDVQLLCFTVLFGVLAAQRWHDRTRRWLWYSFLVNGVGAILDFAAPHLPGWLANSVASEMIPLSYAVLNVAIVAFDRRRRNAGVVSALLLLAAFPLFLYWQGPADQLKCVSLGDLMIAVECIITVVLLLGRQEALTRAPRRLMAGFFVAFIGIELVRVWSVFVLHLDPDGPHASLAVISAVAYVVNVSLLPLGFVWMMQARSEWELLQQSIIDPLTTVLNRRGLEQAIDRELARYRRYREDFTLAILDLDHFKSVNDRYGHPAGDAVLQGVAAFLARRVRKTDVLGRLGGEEFVLLFPHTEITRSAALMEELCAGLRDCRDLLPPTDVRVTASFGVTSTRERETVAASDLLREADVALYEAKQSGRDRVSYFKAPDWFQPPDGPGGSSEHAGSASPAN